MSSTYLWITIAALGFVIAGIGLYRFLHRPFEQKDVTGEGESEGEISLVPLSPLQKLAWWGLGIGVVTSISIVAVLIKKGATNFDQDKGMRLLVLGIFFGGMALYGLILWLIRRRTGHKEIVMDERDRTIMNRVLAVQLIAVLISLALWSVILREIYWEGGVVPIIYPDLMFWSCFIIAILSKSVGILLGYRRM
jgi:uncharacterized membrane protein